jgi:hypothetical protein
MEQSSHGAAPAPSPGRLRTPTALPVWIVAIIAVIAVLALALGVIVQVEVAAIHSGETGLSSGQLFDGAVSVAQELAPGNASAGYYGDASFQSATGNGNPLVMALAFLENTGLPVTLEFVVCLEASICGIRDGNLQLVSLTPRLSESVNVLEPATGYYDLILLNLPGYTSGSPLSPFSVQVNVTLLGQLDFYS